MNFNSRKYADSHRKRFENTLLFLQKNISSDSKILDLGTKNKLSEFLVSNGYNINNTKGEDLDDLPEILEDDSFDTVTAFEIFEHLLNPYGVLKKIKAEQLIASVPLNLWFAPAYRNENDPRDRHYHEFEPWQFDMILNKTGWEILASEKWKSFNPSALGIRPILRRFTNRYYIVHCRRKPNET